MPEAKRGHRGSTPSPYRRPQRTGTPLARANPAAAEGCLAALPPGMRALLAPVRRAAREAAPDAVEVLGYRMPALVHHGRRV